MDLLSVKLSNINSSLTNISKEELFQEYSRIETLDYKQQIILEILYTLIAIVSFVLNIATIAVLVRYDKISSELYIYLINLSISDIVMSLFCIPYTYTNFILNQWIFPLFLCPLVNFVQVCSVFVSIWTLTIIGIDRYYAILNPLNNVPKCFIFKFCKNKSSKKLFSILIIWLFGIGSGSVQFIYSKAIPIQYGPKIYYDCREHIPEDYSRIYTIYLFVSTFGLPLVILIYVYSIIGYHIWRHVTPGNAHQNRDINNNLTRDRIMKILILIVSLFFLCWFPLQIFTLLVEFVENFLQIKSSQDYSLFVYGYLICHILAMSHSFVNPIVYCFISRHFWSNFCNFIQNYFVNLNQRCRCGRRRCHHYYHHNSRRGHFSSSVRMSNLDRRKSRRTEKSPVLYSTQSVLNKRTVVTQLDNVSNHQINLNDNNYDMIIIKGNKIISKQRTIPIQLSKSSDNDTAQLNVYRL